jgi:ApbE superfamily uncharacterized protein (UPF0280 family)
LVTAMRLFENFSWKGASYRICSSQVEIAKREIVKQRALLEEYIERHPDFASSLEPITVLSDAPDIAFRMARAAESVGVGPMAAVAGAIAQAAVESALSEGDTEGIVENGGDIYLNSEAQIIVGLFAGKSEVSKKLALRVEPNAMPLAICSSSSHMGHSLSLGHCDLACVVSKDAALADAAATQTCNLVKTPRDIKQALERILAIPGILGVLIVEEDKMGLAGDLPSLVRHQDESIRDKIFTISPH